MPRNLSPSDIENFRGRLCEAATQLLVELGHEGFNMRELAARMGISAMTTYRYFEDKNEILLAVRQRAFGRLAAKLEDASTVCAAGEDKFAALGEAYARFAREERVHYALMFDLSSPHPLELACSEERRVRAALLGFAEDDVLLEADAILDGAVFWSALHGVVALHLSGSIGDAQFARVLTEVVRAYSAARHGRSDHKVQPTNGNGLASNVLPGREARVHVTAS